jgi:hypothetical protein
VAHFFHRLRRTGRTLDSIRYELSRTFYIHRRAVVRELTRCGVKVDNAFGEFMKQTVQEGYHIRGERFLSFFQRHPNLLAVFTKALVLIGAEPNVYLFYRRCEKIQEDTRQKGKRYTLMTDESDRVILTLPQLDEKGLVSTIDDRPQTMRKRTLLKD